MSSAALLWPVLVPTAGGLLCLLFAKKLLRLGAFALVLTMIANLAAVLAIHGKGLDPLAIPFGSVDFTLRFRVDALSQFILLAAAVLGALIALYTSRFMLDRKHANVFFAFFCLTMAMVNGAAMADHLVTLLFFWEGMLVSLYVMIAVGHATAYGTATKAFIINGVTDLCMLAGIGLVALLAGTLTISEIHLEAEGLAGLAFVLMSIGAMSKAGAMPFHSWIPDAAIDAPAPFMSFLPGVMEKLLGIYLLARISLDMFTIRGWASTFLMVIGAVTILLAVLMALIQKDYKRLLAFHAISQVGYMILGIGTGTAVGIVGGLFHMVNHAMYKGTLFLTGGAVERQAGTTDLERLGGLAAKMPITFVCFVIAACSISGVPPFNGFYSKELVYDGALERGWIFYAAAVLGSFFTAASFLKLGHAAYKGAYRAPAQEVKEAPWAMLLPMITIAGLCILFGVANWLPVERLVVPSVARHLSGSHHLSGLLPATWGLAAATVLVQLAAIANHAWGVKRTGSGLGAVDHFHHAPIAHSLYDAAEWRWFDPYVIALKIIGAFAKVMMAIDRLMDFLIEKVSSALAEGFSAVLRVAHTGSHAMYLAWCLVGTGAVIYLFLMGGF